MQKWKIKKKERSKPSEKEGKEGFFSKMKKRRAEKKLYAPREYKKDEIDKSNNLKQQKKASLKQPVVNKVLLTLICVFIGLLVLGSINAFRHNGEISFLNEAVGILADEKEEEFNISSKESVQDFTERFMRAYLTIDNLPVDPKDAEQNEEEERSEKLARFLANGIDEEAGITEANFEGKQTVRSLRVIEVTDTGDNTADVQVRVNTRTVLPDQKEDEEDILETLYFTVGVYGDEEGYSIINLPQPYDPGEDTARISIQNPYETARETNEYREDIQSFLVSFFNRYANEAEEGITSEIRLFFENPEEAQSLNTGYVFENIDTFKVYQAEEENQFIVRSDVALRRAESNLLSLHGYEFLLVRDDGGNFSIREFKNSTNLVSEQ